jgi:hypothetical protein
MSVMNDCCNPCPPFFPPTQVPGAGGKPGANGTNGVNAYSIIANFQGIGFVVPSIGSSATVYVTDTGAWMGLNQPVFITGAGEYLVTAEASVNSNGTFVLLQNLGSAGNAVPGSTISSGNSISPSGLQGTNAYTTTTATFVTPAVGYAATITCANVAWMVVGEIVFVQGGGYFQVSSINTTNNTALLSNPGFANTTAGATIPTGFGVGPSGTQGSLPLPAAQLFYSNSLNVVLSNTLVNIGSTLVTLPAAGTWLLMAQMQGTYKDGSGGSTTPTVIAQLQSQPSGAGPFGVVANTPVTAVLPHGETSTLDAGFGVVVPFAIYSTATVGDVIGLFVEYGNAASVTTQTIKSTSLVAICINLQT